MSDHQKTLAIKFALGFAIVTALGGWQGASFAGMCLSWGLYGIFFYWLYFHGPAAADRLESLQNRLRPLRLPFLILILAVLGMLAFSVLRSDDRPGFAPFAGERVGTRENPLGL